MDKGAILILYPYDGRFIEGNPSMQALKKCIRSLDCRFYVIHPGVNIENLKGERCYFDDALFSLPAYSLCAKIAECFKDELFSSIIPIDSKGAALLNPLIEASQIPVGYISYELRCKDELANEQEILMKELELKSVKHLRACLVPDRWRGRRLAEHSDIPEEIMIYAPVGPLESPSFVASYDKKLIRHKYDLPTDKKLLAYSGAIGEWALMEWLPHIADHLPGDWILVFTGYVQEGSRGAGILAGKLRKKDNVVFLGNYPYEEFQGILKCFDAGLALYPTTYSSYCFYGNLSLIGLSSGKISEYIHAGLPVITSEQSAFNEISDKYACFNSLFNPMEINRILINVLKISRTVMRKSICDFFDEMLDPSEGIRRFFDVLLCENSSRPLKLNIAEKNIKQALTREGQLLRKLLKTTLDLWSSKFGSPELVLYCAGEHTRWLLNNFGEHDFLKNIRFIADESPFENKLKDCRIRKPLRDDSVEFVLISTDVFFEEISEKSRRFYPNASILNFYEGLTERRFSKC